MRGADLVVPIGADQQQVPHLRLRDQMLEQFERRRVQPLQIVEEQRQRMLRPGEHAEEPPEHQLETVLRVLRREVGHRRLLADDERELGNQIDHELAVRRPAPPASAPRQRPSSASLLLSSWRTRLWNAWASVA